MSCNPSSSYTQNVPEEAYDQPCKKKELQKYILVTILLKDSN
jgi:hypothetical protein